MVISEFYRTREDGVVLYRIYSDNELEIQNTITNEIFGDVIDDDANSVNKYIETNQKVKKIKLVEPEIENGDQELTQEEVATMLEEVF